MQACYDDAGVTWIATFSSVPLPDGVVHVTVTVFVAPGDAVDKFASVNVQESAPPGGVDSTVTVLCVTSMLPSTPVEIPSW